MGSPGARCGTTVANACHKMIGQDAPYFLSLSREQHGKASLLVERERRLPAASGISDRETAAQVHAH